MVFATIAAIRSRVSRSFNGSSARRCGRICCNGCAFIAEQLFLAQASARDREALTSVLAPAADAAAAAAATGKQARIDVRGMVCAPAGC